MGPVSPALMMLSILMPVSSDALPVTVDAARAASTPATPPTMSKLYH